MAELAVGVDIGGTKVAAGVVDPSGRVLARVRRDTPAGGAPAAVEDTIAGVVAELRDRHIVRVVGIGAAGFVDEARSSVLFSPHLAWRREPLRDAVEARVGLPVLVENDANAAAWAEGRFGAARGEDVAVCITLGTGIGGGILLGGELFRGRYGAAGEFGHQRLVPDGRRCPCGHRGCWEQYASGNALVRAARSLADRNASRARPLLAMAGGDPARIDGRLVAAAAADGDPACVELVEDVGRWLGVGLAGLACALDPAVFVIGGGMSKAGALLLGPAREAFEANLVGRGYRPPARIVPAALGVDAGLVGAADLARGLLTREPATAAGPADPD